MQKESAYNTKGVKIMANEREKVTKVEINEKVRIEAINRSRSVIKNDAVKKPAAEEKEVYDPRFDC